MQLSPAAQDIVKFWKEERNIPFRRGLISKNADGTSSMSAQVQVLYRNGYSEDDLLKMSIRKVDRETARVLGISIAHSGFLRRINDSDPWSPQEVLTNPERYIGPNWEKVLEFWVYLDTLTEDQLKVVEDCYNDLSDNERHIAAGRCIRVMSKATNYAYDVSEAAFDSVSNANCAAENATEELIGGVENPVFVPMFHNPAFTHRQE